MNPELLARRLEALDFGMISKSIFVHTMPSVNEAILVRLPLDGVTIDHELPGRYKHPFQIVLRGVDMPAVAAKAKAIQEAFVCEETLIEDVFFNFIRARTLPIVYPRSDQSHLAEASINFDCCYHLR